MNLTAVIEALLFVSGGDVSCEELAAAASVSQDKVQEALHILAEKYREGGVVLLHTGAKYRLATNPAFADTIAQFLHTEVTGDLTRPQLETLTIIAYRGPVSKPEIEMVRGMNCTLILRNLMVRGLIEELPGTLENTYALTSEFLRLLGVSRVEELPEYKELSAPDLMDRLKALEEARKAVAVTSDTSEKQED